MSKVILITGASSGFGKACAFKFAQASNSLVLFARSMDKLESIKKKLDKKCSVYIAKLDVTDPDSVQGVLSHLPEGFRNIDVLINSAGLALGLEPANLANLDDWETMVDTNIKGLLRVTRYLLPAMVERNTGHIVNIGSIAGSWPYPGGNVYGATKSFVQNFSQQLRADLIGKNIRVTNIDPGLALTEFSNVRFKGDTDKASKVYENTKPLSASDIAEIIYWTTSVPPHVNINAVEVMPVCQAWSALTIDRNMIDNS